MLNYEFMRIALISAVLVSVLLPLIGAPLVQKRLSNMGDALSHTSLLGVAIGLVAGFSTILGAILISVLSSLVIEFIRRKFQKYAELSVVIVMSFAVALVAILSHFVNSGASLSSYMFGSITLITKTEMYLLLAVTIITLIFFIGFYKQIFYTTYNELQARLDNVPVRSINLVMTILTAIIIALASKTVGALMVSSLMVIPYASSIQVTKSYKFSIVISQVFALISSILGTVLSYYLDLPSGGVMVVVAVIILICSLICNQIFKLNK